jgi:hypothetical protein
LTINPLKTLGAESEVAIPAGFEPATHGVEIRYSIQLSYGTVRRPGRKRLLPLPLPI